jgi:hypothetical protein
MEALSSKRSTGTNGDHMSAETMFHILFLHQFINISKLPLLATGTNSSIGVYLHHCIFSSYIEIYMGNVLNLFKIFPPQAKGCMYFCIGEYKETKMIKKNLVYVEKRFLSSKVKS